MSRGLTAVLGGPPWATAVSRIFRLWNSPQAPGWAAACLGGRCKLIYLPLIVSLVVAIADAQPSVTLTNTTRGGIHFYVGDNFVLTIAGGTPNATVSVAWTQNGVGGGPSPVATTSGIGGYQTSGIMDLASVGSWTETWYVAGVQASPTLVFMVAPGPNVTLTNLTWPGDSNYLVGDHLRVNITGGLPNASVTMAWTKSGTNNGPLVFGATDAAGSFLIADSPVNDTHVGPWTETWYVAGKQAVPVLSFNVFPTACSGSINPTFSSILNQGQSVLFTYSDLTIFASQRPSNVVFRIDGASSNPYSAQVAGSHPNPTDWTASVNPGGLGAYRVTPTVSYTGISISTPCGAENQIGLFQVQSPNGLPNSPSSPGCTSLTGHWNSSSPGHETVEWTFAQNPGGPLSVLSVVVPQGQSYVCTQINYTGSGTYTSSTRQYSLAAINPFPSFVPGCIIATFENESGMIVNNQYCGYATGSFTSSLGSGPTTFVRGAPPIAGETTAFINPNSVWADQYGHPTLAGYKATLFNLDPSMNYSWAGNRVKEQSPPGTGVDGCLQSGDPFERLTAVTPGPPWFVQADQHFEPDFIGYGAMVVGWLQLFRPSRLPCTVTVRQQMAMFRDNVAASDPAATQTTNYGSTNSGNTNIMQITVSQTGVTVSRAAVSATRAFHF